MAWAVVYQGRLSSVGIMMGGAGIIPPMAGLPPKQHKVIKNWENGENGKMTPAKLYIARLYPFSPILGKWENGENKGKMGSYHACHNATNGMMGGIAWLGR